MVRMRLGRRHYNAEDLLARAVFLRAQQTKFAGLVVAQIGETSMAVEANLEVFADYFQVHLADPLLEDDWSDAWQAPSAVEDRFIMRPRILCFCTERNSTFRCA
jgi:hypothetical protein